MRTNWLDAETGFLTGAACIASPSLLGLFGSAPARAQAMGCGISAGAGKIPFVCFDLAGGASVSGSNIMVGGPGGQLDFLTAEGYLKLGLPSDMLPSLPNQVNTELGLAFHVDSAFLRGILDKTSVATRANINGAVIPARCSLQIKRRNSPSLTSSSTAGVTSKHMSMMAKLPSASESDSAFR